ncbi:type II toxin-antitoxin system RelE/ParE family toxin [Mucilaginibacter sp.]|uniref:type II toxin-antitoxin system RelE/ParE family toxin n=1 Tax=Mucilaginibacter sp. TaxID=1882438 RepID=UPI0035BC4024
MFRFKNEEIEKLWEGLLIKRLDKTVRKLAQRRLQLLIAAVRIEDLKVPPSNKLEALKGDRRGRYSVRVNDQYRLCFVRTIDGAQEIEFIDYH